MDVFEKTNTDEEERNLYQDQEPMVHYYVNQHSSPHCVSSETGTESDSEDLRNDFNENYDSHHGVDEDIDTDDFTNQISDEDRNKTTPLYDGSPISVHDACVHLIQLSHLLNLNKNRLQMLLKELLFFSFRLSSSKNRPHVIQVNR